MSGISYGEHDTVTVTVDTGVAGVGPHSCDLSISSTGGSGVFSVSMVVEEPVPELSFTPSSFDFGTLLVDVTDETSFDIWNSGTGDLAWSISESCDWVEVSPSSGSSSGESDMVTAVSYTHLTLPTN